MSILYIKNKDGKFVPIKAIKGKDGKSAYELAVEGGFIGTYEEFCQALSELTPNTEHTENKNNPHDVTAAQVGAIPIIQASDATYNMDDILTSGKHFALYNTVSATLGTPSKYGVTSLSSAAIFSYSNGSYGYQLAFMAGSIPYMRTYHKDNGISDWTRGCLPLSGGRLTGRLTFENLTEHYAMVKGRTIAGNNHFITFGIGTEGQVSLIHHTGEGLADFEGTDSDGRLELNPVKDNPNALVLRETSSSNPIRIFGEHNKPTRTYVGNQESRTIKTGGIGNVLLLWSSTQMLLVTPIGGVCLSATVPADGVGYSHITFTNGVLTFGTSGSTFNERNVTYHYQVL